MRPNFNNLKFLKLHRKKRITRVNRGKKGQKLSNYNFGMLIKDSKVITSNQLEAVRKLIVRKLKGKSNKNNKNLKIIKSQQKVRKAKKKKVSVNFNLRHNFSLGLTKKPLQVRMGKGKGGPVDWVYPCASNRVLFELQLTKKVREKKARKILIKASEKLPSKIKFIAAREKAEKMILFSSNKIKCIKEL